MMAAAHPCSDAETNRVRRTVTQVSPPRPPDRGTAVAESHNLIRVTELPALATKRIPTDYLDVFGHMNIRWCVCVCPHRLPQASPPPGHSSLDGMTPVAKWCPVVVAP